MIDKSELKEKLEQHKLWLQSNGGLKANLRYADLRYANLRDADLRYADLRDADLRYADLRYANLRDADLRYADLRDADLRGADLSSAILIYMQLDQYQVFVQKEKTRIGCEYHDNAKWIEWTPKDVAHMDNGAKVFWKKYKTVVVAAIMALNEDNQ